MPNWTQVNINIKRGSCPDDVWDRITSATISSKYSLDTKPGFMGTLRPIPPESEDDWYNWNCQNWGCKWDIDNFEGSIISTTEVRIRGQTPWGYPDKFLEFVRDIGNNVICTFSDEDFSGNYTWDNGECYTFDHEFKVSVSAEIDDRSDQSSWYKEISEDGNVFFCKNFVVTTGYEFVREVIDQTLFDDEFLNNSIGSRKDGDILSFREKEEEFQDFLLEDSGEPLEVFDYMTDCTTYKFKYCGEKKRYA